MIITRQWVMPNKWTFRIKPVEELVQKYIRKAHPKDKLSGKRWVDPFCGMSDIAEFRNDLNPESEANYNMEVYDFVELMREKVRGKEIRKFRGVLFDPPYSMEQIKRSYDNYGLKSKLGFSTSGAEDPTGGWVPIKDKLSRLIRKNGYVISFGWNSNGFGKKRGFEIVEILLLAHGGNHNDTICVVEQKVRKSKK